MRPALQSLWQDYLAAERTGYRRRYLAVLAELCAAVASVEDRDQLARTAFRAHERSVRQVVLRDPLRTRVLLPFVRDHLADPRVMWWALTTRTADPDLLADYRRYDRVSSNSMAGAITYALAATGEPRWWRRLLDHRLAVIEHGTHHLDEGHGLVDGTTLDYVLQVCAAIAIVDQAPPGTLRDDQHHDLVQEWSLLRDWVRYDAAGRPGGDFPAWCRQQGSEHWVAHHTARRHYYYSHHPRSKQKTAD